ncbi:MAG: RNA polymerase sigma factor [Comamonas sp.]
MAVRYYKELIQFFARRTSLAMAEDLTQEVYVRLAQQPGQALPRGDEAMRAWVFHIAKNLWIDQQRQDEVRRHESDEVLLEMPAPCAQQPEACYEDRERWRRLAEAIEALPVRCREAFVLHKFEGLSHAEVAERMQISRNMVERHVMLAVTLCRRDCDPAQVPAPGRDAAAGTRRFPQDDQFFTQRDA